MKATPAETSVSLGWSAVTGATEYEISYGQEKTTRKQPSAVVQGLTAETNYTFRVVAKADGYEDSPSAEVTTRTLSAEPETHSPN
ncbi:fibronectin type III domain-containing protein [Streptomyces sp. NPDC086554]|uniref:fibronectin type III domain-containing protein n=1 Tax=Streptomyces sp. NPDC086554 TaxID=3154864 RepID=UPI003449909D